VTRSVVLAVLLTVVLAGCLGDSERPATNTHRASTSTEAETASRRCPITLSNGSVPPDAADWGPTDSYGNGKLWTLFWPYGVVLADEELVEKDGSIGVKWPWWRNVTGRLRIDGRRLDKSGGRLRADIPAAYGVRGFQPTSIYFASEGCWEVTGRAGGTTLTFVTLVAKASTYGLALKRG
jgi:hypothetical protein